MVDERIIEGNAPDLSTAGDDVLSQEVSLESARNEIGQLLLPSHLPEGFSLLRTTIDAGHDVTLVYGPSDDGTATTENVPPQYLTVQLLRHVEWKVKRGSVRQVEMNSRIGAIVEGSWVKMGDDPVEWQPDEAKSVVFQKSRWNVIVTAPGVGVMGETAMDAAYITRIAESLEDY